MLIMLYGFLALLGLIYVTWVAYLSMMTLMPHRDRLTLGAKMVAYPLAAGGITCDFCLNASVGTILFLEIPRELLFTARLQRQIETGRPWRATIAHWICHNYLDQFDPRGYHCCKPCADKALTKET